MKCDDIVKLVPPPWPEDFSRPYLTVDEIVAKHFAALAENHGYLWVVLDPPLLDGDPPHAHGAVIKSIATGHIEEVGPDFLEERDEARNGSEG